MKKIVMILMMSSGLCDAMNVSYDREEVKNTLESIVQRIEMYQRPMSGFEKDCKKEVVMLRSMGLGVPEFTEAEKQDAQKRSIDEITRDYDRAHERVKNNHKRLEELVPELKACVIQNNLIRLYYDRIKLIGGAVAAISLAAGIGYYYGSSHK